MNTKELETTIAELRELEDKLGQIGSQHLKAEIFYEVPHERNIGHTQRVVFDLNAEEQGKVAAVVIEALNRRMDALRDKIRTLAEVR